MKATARWLVVAITICCWIAISNHCAFAAIATKTDSAPAVCPFHSKQAKQKKQSSQTQCCKILRALVLAKTKAWARDHVRLSDIDFFAEERAHTACSARTLPPLLLDTGPPAARSFAELILQQSLLAHAPPIVA